ncbi:XdhC family protein, partial [Acinetobacter baumannii]
MPDDTVMAMKLDERCAVIALTHDPKLDDLALMEALKTPAFYVGALGSRRNNASRRERLKEFDLTEAELARLHGPVGIYIGSRT